MLHKVVDYYVFTGLSPGRRPIHNCRGCRAHIGGDAPGVAHTIGTTEMISPRYQQADLLSHPLLQDVRGHRQRENRTPSYPSTPANALLNTLPIHYLSISFRRIPVGVVCEVVRFMPDLR